MQLPSYFKDFLSKIRLTKAQVADLKKGHSTLRARLESDEDLSDIVVCTFLQGSYRRATAIKPREQKRSDVDVIVVTNLDKDRYSPAEVFDLLKPFMDKHYKGKYRLQGRSYGIELSCVDQAVHVQLLSDSRGPDDRKEEHLPTGQ